MLTYDDTTANTPSVFHTIGVRSRPVAGSIYVPTVDATCVKGRRVQYIHHLHQIYGPVVRTAPNEIDVTDLHGYHAIHKIGNGIRKSEWYPRFRTAQAKDPISPFLEALLVSEKAQSAVQKVKAKGVCDRFEWWTYYTVDVIGRIAFGESFGMLELGKKTEFIQMFENFAMIGILRSEFPTLYRLICLIPSFIYDINRDEKTIIRHDREIIDRAKEGSIDRRTVFTGFLTETEINETVIPRDSIVTEATGLVGAGGRTTSVTLTYLVWAVLSNHRIQEKLEEEVATLPSDFTDAELEALPYMNAVIEETLRTYGPVPGALPRVVSEAGLHTSGHFIPPGTIVCTQSYSMHRKSEIYSNPECFEPERFLRKDYAGQEERSAFAAFGAGSRTCLGVHLAYMELRMAVALLFRECAGARLALSSPDDMDMVNFLRQNSSIKNLDRTIILNVSTADEKQKWKGEPKSADLAVDPIEKEIDIYTWEQNREEYLEKNWKGQVPLLLGPQSVKLDDSLDITRFLSERYPQLLPSAHRDSINELLNELHQVWFVSLSFTAEDGRSEGLVKMILHLIEEPTTSEKYKTALQRKLQLPNPHAPEIVVREEQKAQVYLNRIADVMLEHNVGRKSTWIFGDDAGPTALDAHTVVFIARFIDAGRTNLIGDDMLSYGIQHLKGTSHEPVNNRSNKVRDHSFVSKLLAQWRIRRDAYRE
ncbi:uncharacterized protein Z518_04597 [Rhinocladiella mackenziei CBS 650.93]|uniref:Cytochrome P450 n=1 Tax=Rhinocladiella mackenziei CBS 650.93 TaxID=1442369 RepID=A0A0D2ITX4_9EURO|nr:uncharacterized protein Z518_04597 [Rhinocladiella mackenziei CBS 650.93]KIX06621.1 hypothetical protein Z518_04597 [Rhinocladiella mackenziei CBS 650.93]